MKKSILPSAFSILILSILLTSCEAIAGIFKAGAGFGIFTILAVAVVIVYLITRLRKNRKN